MAMLRRSFRCPPSSNVNIALAVTSTHKRRMTQQIDRRTPHYSQKKRTLAGNDVVSNKRFDYCLELHVEGTGTHESFTAIDLLKKKWNSRIATSSLCDQHFNIGKRFPVVVFNFISLLRRPCSRSVAQVGGGCYCSWQLLMK